MVDPAISYSDQLDESNIKYEHGIMFYPKKMFSIIQKK